MGIKDFLKNRDEFGHQVTLNFNRKGDTVYTSLGGFFSLVYKSFIYFYLLRKIRVMWSYGDDTVISRENELDVNNIGGKFDEMNMLFFFYFMSAESHNSNQIVPYDLEEFRPYLNMMTYHEK